MKRWLQIGLVVLGIGIFIYILATSGPEALAAVFNGDLSYLLLALVATGVAQMISGWRLQVALGAASTDARPPSRADGRGALPTTSR